MMVAADISSGLEPIRHRFLSMLHERQIETLNDLEVALNTPDQAAEALGRIEATLHKIAGTAGTLGFDKLGQMARQVEEQIMAYLADPTQNADAVYDAIVQFLNLSIGTSTQAA